MPRTRLCSACTVHLPITKGISVAFQLQAPLPCALITAGHGKRWKRQLPAAAQGSISGEFGSPGCGTLDLGRRLAAHVTLLAVRGSGGRYNGVLNDRRPHNPWRPQLLVQGGETVALRSIAPLPTWSRGVPTAPTPE